MSYVEAALVKSLEWIFFRFHISYPVVNTAKMERARFLSVHLLASFHTRKHMESQLATAKMYHWCTRSAWHGIWQERAFDAACVNHVFPLFVVLRWCTRYVCVYVHKIIVENIKYLYLYTRSVERGDCFGVPFMCRMTWYRVSVSLLPLSGVQRLLLPCYNFNF